MEVLMKKKGTKVSDFKQATELTSSEQVGALCDGKVQAIAYTVGVPNGPIGRRLMAVGHTLSTSTLLLRKVLLMPILFTHLQIFRRVYFTKDKRVMSRPLV